MHPRRIAGIVLLVIGIILLVVGLSASESIPDQLSSAFTGKWTDSTAWYIYGGLAATIGGGLLVLFGGGRKG